MCQVLIESIKAVFSLSLLSINYQQHEKLRVEVHRFDSSAVGVGEMGAQMFWRHGSTHFAAKSKRWNVESRSERQGTGTQVTTSSVSTQKTNCSRQAVLHINPSLHTASPLSPLIRTLWIWVILLHFIFPVCWSRPRERRASQSSEEPAGEIHPSLFVMDEGSGKWKGANANVLPCARLLMVPSNMESCDSVLSALGCH